MTFVAGAGVGKLPVGVWAIAPALARSRVTRVFIAAATRRTWLRRKASVKPLHSTHRRRGVKEITLATDRLAVPTALSRPPGPARPGHPCFLALASAASIFLMYLAGSFLKSFRHDLQQSLISRPSWTKT